MDLSPYVTALRDNLAAAAAVGDENTRIAARVLTATLEPAARLALMNALSDLAAEVTLALEDRVVEVRLDGQDVQVVVTGPGPGPEEPEQPEEPQQQPPLGDAAGDIRRITVRLMEELKDKAEQAAAAQGMSLNAFVSQALQGALGRERHRPGPGAGRGEWGNWGNWGNFYRDFGRDFGAGFGRGSGARPKDKPWQDEPQQGEGSSRVRGWVEG
jgi:hypothetical protein